MTARPRATTVLLFSALWLASLPGCGDDAAPAGDSSTNDAGAQNELPIASARLLGDGPNGGAIVELSGSDSESRSLVVDVTEQPQHGALDVSSGPAPLTVTYTPESDFSGSDRLEFTVTNTVGQVSLPETVLFLVADQTNNPNAPSTVSDPLVTLDEDSNVNFELSGSDNQDAVSELSIAITSAPERGVLNIQTGTAPLSLTYTPETDYYGLDALVFQVTDSDGLTASSTVVFEIRPVNDAPVATDDTMDAEGDVLTTSTVADLLVDVLANDSDVDDALIFVSSITQPEHGSTSIDVSGGVRFIPEHPFTRTEVFDYTVSDGQGGSADATVSVVVTLGQPVVIESFTVDPTYVAAGGSSSLTWDTTAATDCTITPDVGVVDVPNGTEVVVPVTSRAYQLLCNGPLGPVTALTELEVSPDSDFDGLIDALEVELGYDPENPDMDDDGLLDGSEDRNGNGVVDAGETDPFDPDSDDDFLPDGVEDFNGNGVVDEGETDPNDPDSDGDGYCDWLRPDEADLIPADDCTESEVLLVAPSGVAVDWADTYETVQAAMIDAQAGQQVWLSQGRHLGTDGFVILNMKDDVDVYGGFLGLELSVLERVRPLPVTTLDGEDEFAGVSAATARLDGVTIANCSGTDGAGLRNSGDSPRLFDVTFVDNQSSDSGGGIHNTSGGLITIERATFIGNTAVFGGGIDNDGSSEVRLLDVVFEENNASSRGGALFNAESGTAYIERVRFVENTADAGGAIGSEDDATLTVLDSQFEGNNADSGGAIQIDSCSATFSGVDFVANTSELDAGAVYSVNHDVLEFTDVFFTRNSAQQNGGALFLSGDDESTTATLERVQFSLNQAGGRGGGMSVENAFGLISNSVFFFNTAEYGGGLEVNGGRADLRGVMFLHNLGALGGGMAIIDGGTSIIVNSTFYENSAVTGNDELGDGGAIALDQPGELIMLINVTITDNVAEAEGGGMLIRDGDPTVYNSLIYGNESSAGESDFFGEDNQGMELSDSCYGSVPEWADVFDGFQLEDDPRLVMASGQIFLSPESNCIDAGDVDFVSDFLEGHTDLNSLTVFEDGTLDEGVFDIGRHHEPDEARITTFIYDEDSQQLSWSGDSPEPCWLGASNAEGETEVETSGNITDAENAGYWLRCTAPSGPVFARTGAPPG